MMTFEELAAAPIGDLRSGTCATVSRTDKAGDAVKVMSQRSIGSVLVVDSEGQLVGIFTEHDVTRRVDLSNDAWRDDPVSKYMTSPVKTVAHSTSTAAALLLMTSGKFRRLPVVNDSGTPVAVISIRYIIEHIAACFPKDFINLPPDPDHETFDVWGG